MTPDGARLIGLERSTPLCLRDSSLVQIDASGRVGAQDGCFDARLHVLGRQPRPLARRSLAGLRIERVGNDARDVRAAVPGTRHRALAGLDRGGKPAAVVARRRGALLSRRPGTIDGGCGRESRTRACAFGPPRVGDRDRIPLEHDRWSVLRRLTRRPALPGGQGMPNRRKARRSRRAGSCWCRTGSTSCGAWRLLAATETDALADGKRTSRTPDYRGGSCACCASRRPCDGPPCAPRA